MSPSVTTVRSTARVALLLAVVVALGVSASTAGAAAAGARPHSKIVTYARGDVRVQRLQLALTRSDHRLHGRLHLTVRNELPRAVRRELRIGRCTGGAPYAPTCPTTSIVHVRLAAGEQHSYTASVTLRQPPTHPDSVQAALVSAGAPTPYAFHSNGVLLLAGRAWRGASAGRTYGVRFASGDAARRLNFDIPVTAPNRAYIDVKWQGTAAPTQAATIITRCAGATCTDTRLRAQSTRSGAGLYGDRFDFTRAGADRLGLRAVSPDGTTLFDAALPWPA